MLWVTKGQCGSGAATYSTVSVAVKYLRWQRVALRRLLLRGNVLVHPLPLFLRHGDVHFLELYLVGFQKSNHILLLLLDLERRQTKGNAYLTQPECSTD